MAQLRAGSFSPRFVEHFRAKRIPPPLPRGGGAEARADRIGRVRTRQLTILWFSFFSMLYGVGIGPLP